MIDLNKEFLTKEIIFRYVSEYDIFSHYLPEIKVGKSILSPEQIRGKDNKKDTKPSFNLYYAENNRLLFKDFGTGKTGDCFDFVQKFYGISYYGALSQVALDFGFESDYQCSEFFMDRGKIATSLPKESLADKEYKPTEIEITLRSWLKRDILFWKRHGISIPTLTRFRVLPISQFFINGKKFFSRNYSYAYVEKKDGRITYKIYQPYSTEMKWVSNTPYSVHQGYSQLPKKGDLLIITKSLKDVMALYETAGLNSIGLQAESIFIKDSVVREYKQRFREIFCLFDNDMQGVELAKKYKVKYGLKGMIVPYEYSGAKDYSDLVRIYGKTAAKSTILDLIIKLNSNNNGKIKTS